MDYIITAHKQAELTERYLSVIAERTKEGIVVIDLSGDVQLVNAAWATMHGYENRQPLIGKHISIFHTKEQMGKDVIPFIEEVKCRDRLAGPVDHVRRDGTLFTTETLMVVFKDRMGKALGLVGFATDITEQQRIKDEVKRCHNHLAEIVKQQAEELKAANEQLRHEILEHEQARQHLRQQITELSVANEQLQHEFVERKQAEEYLRQQIDELKAVSAQLQEQIDELRARNPIGKADVCNTTVPHKAVESFSRDEEILAQVFRENAGLQKPGLVDVAIDKSFPEELSR